MLLHELALDPSAAPDDAPALISPAGTWSRADLRSAVQGASGAASTVAPAGGRIAIVSDSRPEVVALLLGIPAAGRVAVPINVRLTPEEIGVQLEQAGVEGVIGTHDELGRLEAMLAELPAVRTTVGLDPEAGDISLQSLAGAPTPTPAVTPRPGDPTWLIATSGTTGQPKLAVLTARSLGAAVATTAAARPLADDDVYLYPFPLYHVSAYNVLHALSRGRPVVLPRRFEVGAVTQLSDEHRVTTMSLAPTMLRLLLDHRASHPDRDTTLADLRTVAYGAAPLAPALLAEASETLGVGFAQGYGMTELSGNAVFLGPEQHRQGLGGEERFLTAAGYAGPGVEIEVIDGDGATVGPGVRGEVCVRGDQVFAGYWHDREATAAAEVDGWLRTGDIGVLAEDGLLSIVDRAKDIIVTGGENVASREVEDVINAHPMVSRVAVIGVADDRWGEAVCAVVVVRAGAEHDPDQLRVDLLRQARARLAGFKVPKQVLFADDLPVNASGKVLKADLRRQLPHPTHRGGG